MQQRRERAYGRSAREARRHLAHRIGDGKREVSSGTCITSRWKVQRPIGRDLLARESGATRVCGRVVLRWSELQAQVPAGKRPSVLRRQDPIRNLSVGIGLFI